MVLQGPVIVHFSRNYNNEICSDPILCGVGHIEIDWTAGSALKKLLCGAAQSNIGALTIRTRFWGPLYYNCNKELPE